MYPEFNNEEIKDISTDKSAEPKAEISSTDGESAPEIDIASPDTVNEKTESEEEVPEAVKADEAQTSFSVYACEELTEESLTERRSTELHNTEEDFPSPAPSGETYLFYGGVTTPEGINYKDTLKFLTEQLKYDGGELRQARQKKDGSGIVNQEEKATEFCSYCGLPISGIDYYRLPDGRKRCTNCNRSLVKSLEELNTIFNDVLLNMELFFGATIDVPISVEMLEERKLKKKIGKGLGKPPKNALILGVAVERKGKYTVYIENGIPRASLIATLAHELTHIWQYTHWNVKNIKKQYGSKMRLIVYEGMAMWSEIQYLYHIGEQTIAKRDELSTLARDDEYGIGFAYYADQYPLKKETKAFIETPFSAGETPLDLGI